MTKPRKPAPVKLSELTPGQHADFFAQLAEKKAATTRDGKPFFTCKFRDAKRTASVPVWADGGWFEACRDEWAAGQFYKVRGTLTEHEKYGPQIEIEQIREAGDRDRADGFSEADFQEHSRFDAAAMRAELDALVAAEIGDAPLKALVQKVLADHADAVRTFPATARHFYPFPGGWLEHTLSVVKSCVWLADKYAAHYPDLAFSRDLVVAGAAVHDLGRLLGLDPTPPGQVPESSRAGHLFGPHLLAFDALADAARGVQDLDPETFELLRHVVVTHLTRPEWGSPKLPAIPEVLILHHADDLDAKFEMYARCLSRDTADGPFTERDPILGKQLLKARRR